MWITTILSVTLLVSFVQSIIIPATHSLVTWQGRKTNTQITTIPHSPSLTPAVAFDWEGVRCDFTLTNATYVTFTLFSNWSSPCLFHVYSNNQLLQVLRVNTTVPTQYKVVLGGQRADTDVSEGSSRGVEVVTLWSVTDPVYNGFPTPMDYSIIYVVSFESDGQFGSVPQRSRRLEIIGDSITAGNQLYPPCTNASCDDHSGTYGAKLCESFQANCTTLAISGKGLYVNCCDNDITMTTLVDRTHVTDPTSIYDWSLSPPPSAILLNLGTNDWGHGHDTGPAWEKAFTEAYVAFLVKLTQRHKSPHLPIFCGVGPITNVYGSCVLSAMEEARTKYGVVTYYIDYSGAPLDGCGHPGVKGHQAMFEIARPIIASVLNWID